MTSTHVFGQRPHLGWCNLEDGVPQVIEIQAVSCITSTNNKMLGGDCVSVTLFR